MLFGEFFHFGGDLCNLTEMCEGAAAGFSNTNGNSHQRKLRSFSAAVEGLYITPFQIQWIIKPGNQAVEGLDNLHSRLFRQRLIDYKNKIITADMADKAALRLFTFNDTKNNPAGHFDGLITTAETVAVIKRLEKIEVRVAKGKLAASVNAFLDFLVDGNIAGQSRQRVDFHDALRTQYG